MDSTNAREWFTSAAAGFTGAAVRIDPAQFDSPGLGDWSVRSLLGHTCRAFLTTESYLAAAAGTDVDGAVFLPGPIDYFTAAFASLGEPGDVAARGVAAGAALGDEPVAQALAIAERVTALVAATDDDAPVATPVGLMRLIDYLPTRAFELTVHSLDLTEAIGADPGPELERSALSAIDLAVALAEPQDAVRVLRAITGRGGLAEVFTVLAG